MFIDISYVLQNDLFSINCSHETPKWLSTKLNRTANKVINKTTVIQVTGVDATKLSSEIA